MQHLGLWLPWRREAATGATLLHLMNAIGAAGSESEAASAALDGLRADCGWRYAAYFHRDPLDNLLKCVVDSGDMAEEFRRATTGARFGQGEALSGRAWDSGDLVVIADFGAVTAFARAPIARRVGVRTAVCIPLIVNHEVLGTLELYDMRTRVLSPAELDTLRKAGGLVSGWIAQRRLAQFAAMLQNSPINTIRADRESRISYVNPAAHRTLQKLQAHLPISVDQLLGQPVEILHAELQRHRSKLQSPAALPHKARVELGSEVLDLLVSPLFDAQQEFLGPMITWEVVTKRVQGQVELERVLSMVQSSPAAILSGDPDLTIRYMNPAAVALFEAIAGHLPMAVEAMSGNSVTQLTEHPARMELLLRDPNNLPHRWTTQFGPATVEFVMSAIRGQKGEYLGPMLTCEDISRSIQMERQVSEAADRQQAYAAEAITAAGAANGTVAKLESSSSEVGRVVKVIANIARQTNLLALNATIEATRVGVVGKGFAVVATEVKELAKESAQASEDISARIEAIQADARHALDAIRGIGELIGRISASQEQPSVGAAGGQGGVRPSPTPQVGGAVPTRVFSEALR